MSDPSGSKSAPLEVHRLCKLCEHEFPLTTEFFYSSVDPRTNRRYFNWRCKPCSSKYIYSKYPSKQREHRYKHSYGLSLAAFEELAAKQQGVCAICGEGPKEGCKNLSVDHDHATGKVRGLLCRPCNFALGHMEDDSARLRRAADYLDSK